MTSATAFEILPAIDLRGGHVVRLRQGDFAQETRYDDAPTVVAERFAAAGARWLHVVDLDGARSGTPGHAQTVGDIVATVGAAVRVEVAGGVRSLESVASVLSAGAARVVVGTAALADPAFAGGIVAAHGPSSLAVAIDVRDGRAIGHGWAADAPGVPAEDAIRVLADAGVETFEVTAIERDGLLDGPDIALYESLVRLDRGAIIASAGVTRLADIAAIRSVGCVGVIIGRALYEGRIDLADAIADANDRDDGLASTTIVVQPDPAGSRWRRNVR